MNVLLIVPTHAYAYCYPAFVSNSDFPVGFAYLAAALKAAGHEVAGVNPNNDSSYSSAHDMIRAKITEGVRKSSPGLIGIGGLCTDFAFIRDALSIVREVAPGTPIVCGGGIINNDTDFIFNLLHPDFCIIGEGEETIVRLADFIEQGNSDFGSIDNLGFWRDGKAAFTRRNYCYPDLDSRTFPDYEPFDIDRMLDEASLASRYLYRYTRPNPRPMTLVAARNCPFSCTFCIHDRDSKYRARSISSIIEEIRYLYGRYRFNVLIILDELFAATKGRIKEFCEALLKEQRKHGWDFDWIFQTHASADLDRETLRLAKDAGCYFFSYGIESASPTVLKSMKKMIHPDQIAKAISLSNEVGIGFGGNFIFGDVAETPETINESLEFVAAHCTNAHIFFDDIKPYPGSKLFQTCLKKGIIKDRLSFYENIDRQPFNMTGMPDREWHQILGQLHSLGEYPYLPPVPAKSVELERLDSPILQNGIRRAVAIRTSCRHCGGEVYYRHIAEQTQLDSEGFNIVTGCPSCNKRIRVAVSVPLNQTKEPRSLTLLENSHRCDSPTNPARTSSRRLRILYLPLEFATWQRASHWSFSAQLGLEHGFAHHGADVVTVPGLCELSSFELDRPETAPILETLYDQCRGEVFDQVWVEVVHTNLDDRFLQFLAGLAPVRVALIPESLEYSEEAYAISPFLRGRRDLVQHRLKYMTHALCVDEADADRLNREGDVRARWWQLTVPARFVAPRPAPASFSPMFCGSLYGKREQWLEHPQLKQLVRKVDSLENLTELPALFDALSRDIRGKIAAGAPGIAEAIAAYVGELRRVREACFGKWLETLAQGSAVVNLPSFFQGYASRVVEAMAAGRPVVSWRIPGHPRTLELFEPEKEILLFDQDDPETLVSQLLRLKGDPELAQGMASAALEKVRAALTTEGWMGEVLAWLSEGVEQRSSASSAVSAGEEQKAKTTVFVITIDDPIFPRCMEAIERQSRARFKVEVLRNHRPFNAAVQAMIDRCDTQYFIQVDEDMILNPDAVAKMEAWMDAAPDDIGMICFLLYDEDREREIQGIKIHRTGHFKGLTPRNVRASEMDLLEQLEARGARWVAHPEVMGRHGTQYSPESVYNRYKSMYEKDIRTWNILTWDIRKKAEKFRETGDMVQLFALLGAAHGIVIGPRAEDFEAKDFQKYHMKELELFSKLFLEDPPYTIEYDGNRRPVDFKSVPMNVEQVKWRQPTQSPSNHKPRNTSLNILHTVHLYEPHVGGSETVVRQISERLVKRGHNVTVATMSLPERSWTSLNGVEVRQFDVAGSLVAGYSGSDVNRYSDFILNHPCDVMLNYAAQQWATDLVYPLLKRIPGNRALAIAPCGYSALESPRTLRAPAFRDYFERVIPTAIPLYDAAVYHSSSYQDFLYAAEHGFTNSVVIPNGVCEDEFETSPPIDFRRKYDIRTKYMGICVANFFQGKGHERLISTVREMNRPDFTMVFIGREGDLLPELRRQAQDMRIEFLVGIPREDTVAAYHAADLFLFASEVEASPLVIIEAKASRTPFVSTDCGNVREFAGGIVCEWSDIARNASALLEDEQRRKQLGHEGYREWRLRLRWEAVVDRYEELYLRLRHARMGARSGSEPRLSALQLSIDRNVIDIASYVDAAALMAGKGDINAALRYMEDAWELCPGNEGINEAYQQLARLS